MNNLARYSKIFVVGCPRSGTSWVTNLIAGHPQVVPVPIETHAYPLIYEPFVRLPSQGLFQRLPSWKGTLRRYGLTPLLFGFSATDIWRGIVRNYHILNRENSHGLRLMTDVRTFESLIQSAQQRPGIELEKAEQVIRDLFDLFFQREGQLGDTLLEKTPMHIRYVDRILQQFPEARVVEVIRDGRDVCASYRALAQQHAWANLGTSAVMRQWKCCIDQGERWRANPEFADRIHVVRYESLKAGPSTQLQQIFEFSGLEASAKQVRAIVQIADIHRVPDRGEGQYVRKGIVGDWQNKLSDKDVEICGAIAGDQLMRLGYL